MPASRGPASGVTGSPISCSASQVVTRPLRLRLSPRDQKRPPRDDDSYLSRPIGAEGDELCGSRSSRFPNAYIARRDMALPAIRVSPMAGLSTRRSSRRDDRQLARGDISLVDDAFHAAVVVDMGCAHLDRLTALTCSETRLNRLHKHPDTARAGTGPPGTSAATSMRRYSRGATKPRATSPHSWLCGATTTSSGSSRTRAR